MSLLLSWTVVDALWATAAQLATADNTAPSQTEYRTIRTLTHLKAAKCVPLKALIRRGAKLKRGHCFDA
jgi:hypothetical protein